MTSIEFLSKKKLFYTIPGLNLLSRQLLCSSSMLTYVITMNPELLRSGYTINSDFRSQYFLTV